MSDDATTKRLTEALRDAKKAARAISQSIDAHNAGALDDNSNKRVEYHRNDAIAQLEFALTALRAAKP